MYELGPHRLMCGDARDADQMLELLGGAKAQVIVTSPPYASQRKYDPGSGFVPVPPDEYVDWYAPVARNLHDALAEDGSYLLNIKEHCDEGQRHLYVDDLKHAHIRAWGWRWIDTFCWRDTKNGVPGGWPNRFKDAWEPVFHFSLTSEFKFRPLANGADSAAVFDYSPATAKTLTGSGLLGVKATAEREGVARPSNVLEIAASSQGGHEAAFPVELPAWFIRAFSDHGDVILDPFAGSGSTLVAAERNGRRCFAMEISPAYCDVIRRRFAALA